MVTVSDTFKCPPPLPIQDAERSALLPADRPDAPTWMEANFHLPPTSSVKGKYTFDYTPFFREPMERYSRPPVEIWLEACTQSGKSTVSNGTIGYDAVVRLPAVGGLFMPREKDAKRRVNMRIRPMFRDNRELFKLIDFDERNLNIGKETVLNNDATLFLGTLTTPADMADNPMRDVKIDELGKAKMIKETGESPVDLLRRRQRWFPDKTLLCASSPQDDGDLFDDEMRSSTDARWWFACPVCSQWHESHFKHVQIDKTDDGQFYPAKMYETGKLARYVCPHCEKPLTEAQRWEASFNGKWLHKNQTMDPDGTVRGGEPVSNKFGYRVTAVMLHPRIISMGTLASEYVEALEEQRKGNLAKLRDFIRNQLAEPWKEVGKSVSRHALAEKVIDVPAFIVPVWIRAVFGGADYHEDENGNVRIDWCLRGFGEDLRRHKIASGHAGSFEELAEVTTHHSFEWAIDPDTGKKPDKKELMMVMGFIDSGDGNNVDKVYRFCRQYRQIWVPIKGGPVTQKIPFMVSQLDKVIAARRHRGSRHGAGQYVGMELVTIDVNHFKDIVMDAALAPAGEPGSISYDAGTPDYYFEEMTNEHKVRVQKGAAAYWCWQPKRERIATHSLDIEVYSEACGQYNNIASLRSEAERRRIAAAMAERIRPESKIPAGNVQIKRKIRTRY